MTLAVVRAHVMLTVTSAAGEISVRSSSTTNTTKPRKMNEYLFEDRPVAPPTRSVWTLETADAA